MSAKKLGIITQPVAQRLAGQDAYLQNHQVNIEQAPTAPVAAVADPEPAPTVSESMTRVTVEIPASLHKKIKRGCIDRDSKMKEEIVKAMVKYFAKW